MENVDVGLDSLPQELIMTVLLPFCDNSSLRNLSKVNKKWRNIVTNFIKDFKKVVQVDVGSNRKLLKFILQDTTKLVKLELTWSLGSNLSDNQLLNTTLLMNQNLEELVITTADEGWISNEVVETIALKLPRLRSVSFSSSRVRMFGHKMEPRKLWPHTCWNSERLNDENLTLHYTEDQVKTFQTQVEDDHSDLPVETKLLACLRLLHSKCRFTDLALVSISRMSCHLMEPLLYHEYKCSKGLFYVRDDDSDNEEFEGGIFYF